MVESEVSDGLSASFAIPEWDPGWEYTGDPRHVRVLAGRLGGEPEYTCPQLQARKARPAIFPVRDRSSRFVERPAFADVPIGLARDVIIDLVEHRVTPTPDTIEQAAVRAAAPRELASSSSLVVQAAVMGYRQLLQNLRASGELASDAVLVTDLVVNDPHRDGGVTEWAAWALYWIARDGSRECHLLTWRDAGSRVRPESRLAVVARVTAEGFRASAPSSWSDRYQPETVQPPPVSAVRIREVGLLDSSCALLVDTDSAGARAMFDQAVPWALPVLGGGAFVPGRGCAGCSIRIECPALPRVPGVLAVAGRAPYVRALSTSDLWQYSVCPQRLHLTADLGLPREPIPQFEGLVRGLLVHAWLEAAHSRGVACTDDDLPNLSDVGDLGRQLEWSPSQAALVAPYLAHHPEQCPLHGDDVEITRPECAITVHDTDADVIFSTRPDLVVARRGSTGTRRYVIRETKTLNLRRLSADIEIALLHHFPQVAAAVCLLASGVDPLEPARTIDPSGSVVELELLGSDGGTVVTFSLDDPDVVLQAQVALADRVDVWIHDEVHTPRPGRSCDSCPVRQWCPVTVFADQGLVTSPHETEAPEIPHGVLALIEADAGAGLDEEFPF